MPAAASFWRQTGAPGTKALCRSGGVGVWGEAPMSTLVRPVPDAIGEKAVGGVGGQSQRSGPDASEARRGRPQGGLDLSHKHFGTRRQ